MQQRQHDLVITLMVIFFLILIPVSMISAADHISIYGLQLLPSDKPNDQLNVTQMLAYHFDKKNYFATFGYLRISKSECFLSSAIIS